MPEIDFKGIRIHYRESGAGQSVLLLHGGGSSGAQWRKVCALMDGDYRMITMDHYGHGGTSPWPGAPEERTHEAEAKLVREVIKQSGGPVHLVGHSFGGGIALRMVATDVSGISSLVLMEPMAMSMLKHAEETEHYESSQQVAIQFIEHARAGRVEEAWEGFFAANSPGAWQSYSEEVKANFYATTDNIVSGYYANLSHATTPEDCRSITLPTLAAYGEATSPRLRRMTEVIAAAIPECALHPIPEAGHMSPLTHPESVEGMLRAHLERCA